MEYFGGLPLRPWQIESSPRPEIESPSRAHRSPVVKKTELRKGEVIFFINWLIFNYCVWISFMCLNLQLQFINSVRAGKFCYNKLGLLLLSPFPPCVTILPWSTLKTCQNFQKKWYQYYVRVLTTSLYVSLAPESVKYRLFQRRNNFHFPLFFSFSWPSITGSFSYNNTPHKRQSKIKTKNEQFKHAKISRTHCSLVLDIVLCYHNNTDFIRKQLVKNWSLPQRWENKLKNE